MVRARAMEESVVSTDKELLTQELGAGPGGWSGKAS